MFGHDVLLGSRKDKNARNDPFPSVEFLWKTGTNGRLFKIYGRDKVGDVVSGDGDVVSGDGGGDELSASEAEVRHIIPAKEFSVSLDETLSQPT